MSLVLSISFKKKDSFPWVRSFAFAKQRNGERQCSYLKPSMDFISIYKQNEILCLHWKRFCWSEDSIEFSFLRTVHYQLTSNGRVLVPSSTLLVDAQIPQEAVTGDQCWVRLPIYILDQYLTATTVRFTKGQPRTMNINQIHSANTLLIKNRKRTPIGIRQDKRSNSSKGEHMYRDYIHRFMISGSEIGRGSCHL